MVVPAVAFGVLAAKVGRLTSMDQLHLDFLEWKYLKNRKLVPK